MRFAIINTQTNIVVNVAEFPSQPPNPPPGYAAGFITAPAPFGSGEIGWIWNGATLTPPPSPPAPPPTVPQQLSTKLAAGIAITSTGTPALNATYALDDITLNEVGAVARDAAAGLGLPGGAGTFAYPDSTGTPRVFTSANVQALYKAMRDLVFALKTTAATLQAGGNAAWPSQAATIA